jgi:mRNA interferase RelE/StbE
MPYRIELGRKARKFLVSLPDKTLRARLKEAIDGLEGDARPPGCLKMKGEEGLYRLRVGDYRIIYQIQDAVLLVLVVEIGNRREIYRR